MAKEFHNVQTPYPDTIEYEIYTDENTTTQVNINNEAINQRGENSLAANVPPSSPQVSEKKRRRQLGEECSLQMNMHNYTGQYNTNRHEYGSPSSQTSQPKTGARIVFDNPGQNVAMHNSYICEAINREGEPVVIDDNLVKDKLILSCRPRRQSQHERTFRKPHSLEKQVIGAPYETPPDTDVHGNVVSNENRYLNYEDESRRNKSPYRLVDKSVSVKSEYFQQNDPRVHSFTTGGTKFITIGKSVVQGTGTQSDAQRYNARGIINDDLNSGLTLNNKLYYGHSTGVGEPRDAEIEINNHRYDASRVVGISENSKIKRERENEHQENLYKHHISHLYADKSTSVGSTYFAKGPSPDNGLFQEEYNSTALKETDFANVQSGVKSYDKKDVLECKKLTRKFITCLWCLFFFNIYLLVIGLTLLVYTSYHFLQKQYMDAVIENSGFVCWIWAVLVFSVFIIIVAIYGIIISIYHNRNRLRTYCVLVVILAVAIIILLISFWIGFDGLKYQEQQSMNTTKKMYRCTRTIKCAWDILQETHQCCGVNNHTEWKFIPRSCCHDVDAGSSEIKDNCAYHYAHQGVAFKRGCREVVEEYYTTMFYIVTGLLYLAFILLLLCFLIGIYLLRKYKKASICQKVIKAPLY